MLIILDTNSLIRFFTNDLTEKAAKVKTILEQEKNIFIPEVVFPELEYIVTDQYAVSRKRLLEIFQFLASQKNIKLSRATKTAITIFEQTKLDMADCIIAGYGLKGSLASFDKELLRVEGVKSIF